MKQPISILIAEDNPDDAELLLRELHRAGFDAECERVDTEEDYLARLRPGLDVILSDYAMPQFSGTRALELLKERGLDVPFIIVSGTIGEDTAVAVMKQGATDYLLKDRLARLGTSIRQALEQRQMHRDRERAEKAMHESEHKYRHLFESLSEAAFLIDRVTRRVIDGNLRAETLADRSRTELLGIDAAALFPAAIAAAACGALTAGPAGRCESEVQAQGGRIIPVQMSLAPVKLYGRDLVLVLMADITERRKADERLREQAAMLDRAHDAIVARDFNRRTIRFWNKGAESLYGWTAGEAIGRDIGALIFADAGEPDHISRELLNADEWHGEVRHRAKDGRALIVNTRATLMRDAAGAPESVLSINNDITEKKNLESQFLRAQRMESIGTLAGGLAHDLNNILSPIMMSVPLLRRELPAEQRDSIVETIEKSAARGAQIVRQVLAFGRGLGGERKPLSLGELIRELQHIVGETFPRNITVEVSTAPDLWPIVGDGTQLHQVLLNLTVNARDAMPAGGTLRIGARNFVVDETFASMLPHATSGPCVHLEVADTGCGIAPENLERIFDPFFTTKGVGQGTGLGLSTVFGIVRSHGGFINLASTEGKGTTFHVFLPAHSGPVGEGSHAAAEPVAPPSGSELVLVVDDEAPVLHATEVVLRSHGYEVLVASDGVHALAVFALHSERIAAVITDVMMPQMDGVALTRALHRLQPALPIVAVTGLGDEAQRSELRALGVASILDKPYGAEAVLEALHAALAGAKG